MNNNGRPPSPAQPPPDGEPVSYEDVVAYYRQLTADLHAQLAVARGQIANRDRVITQLRDMMTPIPAQQPEPVSEE